jgi:hypothetical protein
MAEHLIAQLAIVVWVLVTGRLTVAVNWLLRYRARSVRIVGAVGLPVAVFLVTPIVDIARSHLGAKIKGSAHGALDAAIPEGRFRRPALQIRRLHHCSGQLGRIGNCPKRPERARVNSEGHRLAAPATPSRMRPVVNRART